MRCAPKSRNRNNGGLLHTLSEFIQPGLMAIVLSHFIILGNISAGYGQGVAPNLDAGSLKPITAMTPADFSTQETRSPRVEPEMQPVSLETERLPNNPVSPTYPVSTDSNVRPWKYRPSVADWLQLYKGQVPPIGFHSLEGIAVFPVLKHKKEKAFSDLPILFSREYALKLEAKVPETKVYHPIYTVDELRGQGLGHVYDQIMRYYLKAGRPEPMAMDYLLKQIANNDKPIARVIFVETDLDLSHPDQSSNLAEWAKQFLTDGTPQQIKYFLNSRVQIFDAEKPDFPMVWGGSWRRSIKNNAFYNVTASVFDDSDSQQSFAGLSRVMSREMLLVTPKAAYMAPEYDTAVQGNLYSHTSPANQQKPSAGAEHTVSYRPMEPENQRILQRILGRQNKNN